MNFAQYLAMTNRTSPGSIFLADWEADFLLKDWPDAIGETNDRRRLQRLEEFAIRVRAAAKQQKFNDLAEECDNILSDIKARITYLNA